MKWYLKLTLPPLESYQHIGVYRRTDATQGDVRQDEFLLEAEIPMRRGVFRKPQPPWAPYNILTFNIREPHEPEVVLWCS